MTIQSLYTLAVLTLGAILCIPESSHAFVASSRPIRQPSFSVAAASDDNDVLAAAIDAMYGSGSEMREEVSSFCGNDDGLICPRRWRRVNLFVAQLSFSLFGIFRIASFTARHYARTNRNTCKRKFRIAFHEGS